MRFTPRRVELIGLSLSLLFTLGAMVLAQIGLAYQEGIEFKWNNLEGIRTLLLFFAGLLGCSVALSVLRPRSDQILLPLVAVLGGLSLVFLYRLPIARLDEAGYVVWRTRNLDIMFSHLLHYIVGMVALLIVSVFPPLLRWWRQYRNLTFVLGLLLLVLTALFGIPASPGGPRLSLQLGPESIQPAELIKLLLVGYLASYLAEKQNEVGRVEYRGGLALPPLGYLFPLVVVLGLACFLLFWMRDMGAALILLGVFAALCFVGIAERTFRYSVALVTIAVVLLLLIFPVEKGGAGAGCGLPALACQRLQVWRDPFAVAALPDPSEAGKADQQVGGFHAIAAGSLLGTGLGLGLPEGVLIQVVESDMIFAAMTEELGWVGASGVLLLYLILIRRGLQIAYQQVDGFTKLLAAGITAIIATQVLLQIGGVLGVLPLTGIPLPLISKGGTALLLNMVLIGLLVRLSAEQSRQPAPNSPLLSVSRRTQLLQSGYGFGILLMMGAMGYWSFYKAPTLNPAFADADSLPSLAATQRRTAWAQRVERGLMLAADGSVLVSNTENGRDYHTPSLVHVVGTLQENTNLALTGLELAYNEELMGRGNWNPGKLFAEYFDGQWQGNTLQLTIEPRWQQSAETLLGAYKGSIVVLDAQTGAILTAVSHPLYDPTQPNAPATGQAEQLNRSFQGLYPPGSTFKTVVGAIALQRGQVTADTVFDFAPESWSGTCHSEFFAADLVPSCNSPYLPEMTFTEGYGWSDNILFARLAVQMGGDVLLTEAGRFGIGFPLEVDRLPVEPSHVASVPLALTEPDRLARTGFGQEDVVVTPLQMALVVAGIVNQGRIPQPYLVQQVMAPDGTVLTTHAPQIWREALDPTTAAAMVEIMQASASWGHARVAAVPGVVVGGKTGTAEWAISTQGADLPHSWYTGFAVLPSGRTVAIAIIIEGAGDGSAVAAPMAAQLVQQAGP